MAFSAYRDLLAIDGCHIEGETLHLFPSFSDMPDVVHLYVFLFLAATNCAIIQEFGPSASRSPSGEIVHIHQRSFGFLHLLQGLVEEMNFPAIRFLEYDVLAILAEDFTHRRTFFVCQGLG